VFRCLLFFVAALGASTTAWAHDFWLQPNRFKVAPGAADPMTIQVGHGQFRTRWSGQLERVVRFSAIGAKGEVDLRPALKPDPVRDAVISFPDAGEQMLVFQSNHATSVLPSIRFNDYLKAEGLTPAIQQRARTGKTDAPGREIYSRCAKALIEIGPHTDVLKQRMLTPVGLPLEVVPLKDPYALGAADRLPVQVLYEGRPLPGALVMLTNLEFDGHPVEQNLTDKSGETSFFMPKVGSWLVNVLWTQPIQGNPDADFDTTFSSLTFAY
jgi:uncharacterized GH25 family protein